MSAPQMDYITTWCGRRIEELSREELIEALAGSVRETQQARELHATSERMRELFRRSRRR